MTKGYRFGELDPVQKTISWYEYWETYKQRHKFTFQMSKLAAAIVSYLQNWISSFLLNNKLFTNADGESGLSWQPLTLVSRIFHVTSLRTCVWNWSQYITYLNERMTLVLFDCCIQFSIMFDCLSVRFPNVRKLYLLLSTHREWESFQLCRILQMLSIAATIEVSVVCLQCSLPY